MKYIIKIALIILISAQTIAQKAIFEATLKYSITVRKTDNAKDPKPLQSATYNLFVKGDLSRSDFNSGAGTETTIYNTKTEKGIILKEYSAQKLMINLNKEDWLNQNQLFRNLKFNFETDQKNINGVMCKKANASLENGESLIVYYDPSFKLNNNEYSIALPNIPGLPIQFQRGMSGMTFEYTLSNINYEMVATNNFDYPKSGYRILSYKEAQNLKKGEK
jgi:hypothetical protein